MKKVGDIVYFKTLNKEIGTGKIIEIHHTQDSIIYEVVTKDGYIGTLISDDCLYEEDYEVQEYIKEEDKGVWIARDKDGDLCLFYGKPTKNECDQWEIDLDLFGDDPNVAYYCDLPREVYPEITFENSPVKIKLIIPYETQE